MNNHKIGEFLKGLRIDKGLSQKEIANTCNVSHQAVSKWEKGESIPDLTSLKSLSVFYGITIDEILDGKISEKKSNKANNNLNKEIIKLTMSFFFIFVAFLPFYYDGVRGYNGFQMIFDGEFGLGVMTLIVVLSYIIFQIVFSIFTITRVISFSRGNVLLNRSITVIVMILVWFSITISALYPYPYIIYLVYLVAMYFVSRRILQKLDLDDYTEKYPKYDPYEYLLIYFIVLTVIPVYVVFFDGWFRSVNEFVLPFTIIIYLSSIGVFIYGFIKRKTNKHIANYCKIISVNSMRLLYIMFFFLLYTESYFLDFSANSYDGIMYIVIYVGFELYISSKYSQSIKMKETVSIFKQ